MPKYPNPKKNMSPNSMANLYHWDSEEAKAAQKKSVITRNSNKAIALATKDFVLRMKRAAVDISADCPSGIDILKLLMMEALEAGESQLAAKYASDIAEYEQPKLQRQDITTTEINAKDLTDEELEEALKALDSTENDGE